MHWHVPSKELSNGSKELVHYKACLTMIDRITEGGVVNVFVEHVIGPDSGQEDK